MISTRTEIHMLLVTACSSKNLQLTARLQETILLTAEKLEIRPRSKIASPVSMRTIRIREEVVLVNTPYLFRVV